MPAGQLDFRTSCGSFLSTYVHFMFKRIKKEKIAMLIIRSKPTGVLLGLVLLLTFWGGDLWRCGEGDLLLRCGDVEVNPGPNPDSNTSASSGTLRQTRLSTSQSSRAAPKDPAMAEMLSMMQEMNGSIHEKLDSVMSEVSKLRTEQGTFCDLVSGFKEEMDDLRAENKVLSDRVNDLEQKVDDLENRSRRNNLIFYGIKKGERETNDECERLVRGVVSEKLGLKDKVDFGRVHRLGSKPDSPIIARCTFYKQKIDIIKEKQKLKGTNIFVGEDFSLKVREVRRKLTPYLKEARNAGKRVSMVFDHLLIEGKKFGIDRNGSFTQMK